jgi:oligopeptide/dipeptide ABC transporter ATP-binding protein
MRQRAMIAMGLGCNPRLIIADEPTTALDVTVQAQLLETRDDLRRRFGTAVIIITHNLGVVARYVDRVIVMYAGRLVESASKVDLFTHPKHPYTEALLSAVPIPDPGVAQRRIRLEGVVPSAINPPPGCRFHTRVPKPETNVPKIFPRCS